MSAPVRAPRTRWWTYKHVLSAFIAALWSGGIVASALRPALVRWQYPDGTYPPFGVLGTIPDELLRTALFYGAVLWWFAPVASYC